MLIVLAAIELLLIAVAVVGGLYIFVAYVGAPTSAPRPKRLLWSAVLLPLVVTFASTQFTYPVRHPWFYAVAYVGLAFSLVVGLVLFSAVGFRSKLARFGATAGYLVLLGVACFVVAAFTACGNGDCL